MMDGGGERIRVGCVLLIREIERECVYVEFNCHFNTGVGGEKKGRSYGRDVYGFN